MVFQPGGVGSELADNPPAVEGAGLLGRGGGGSVLVVVGSTTVEGVAAVVPVVGVPVVARGVGLSVVTVGVAGARLLVLSGVSEAADGSVAAGSGGLETSCGVLQAVRANTPTVRTPASRLRFTRRTRSAGSRARDSTDRPRSSLLDVAVR